MCKTTFKPLTEAAFRKIKSAVNQRRASNEEYIRLDDICRSVPDKYDTQYHGIHRWCYQSFTNISTYGKKKRSVDSESPLQGPRSSKRPRLSQTSTIFSFECIICDKTRKSVKGKEKNLIKCVTDTADESIKRLLNLNKIVICYGK